jgi:hypothetical protein
VARLLSGSVEAVAILDDRLRKARIRNSLATSSGAYDDHPPFARQSPCPGPIPDHPAIHDDRPADTDEDEDDDGRQQDPGVEQRQRAKEEPGGDADRQSPGDTTAPPYRGRNGDHEVIVTA